jgi:myo-inositol-1(or 4)-monophosphatase
VAVEAAQLAGAVIRDAYSTDRSTLHIVEKSCADFVTDTDKLADSIIHRLLSTATPGYKIISEELASSDRLTSEPTWIVDPLDGTSAFIHRTSPGQPAVLIALCENSQVTFAVAYFPITTEWFFASAGMGAYEYREGGSTTKISLAAASPQLGNSWVTLNQYGDSSFESKFFRDLRSALRLPGTVSLLTIDPPHSGAGCRAVSANSGLAAIIHDGGPANPKQRIWDIAAVKLIVEEAGGVFLDSTGKPCPLEYDGPIVVARTPALAKEILSLGDMLRQ